ncbi:MAG: transcription termination factor NusA [Minisyncoccales bacterium]
MFEIKSFISAITQISEEKGIPQEKVIGVIEQALAAAYKKDYGKKGQIIKAKLSPKIGKVKFWQIRMVVSKDMIYSEEELEKLKEATSAKETAPADKEEKIRFNPEKHIIFEEAKKIEPKIKVGDELELPLEEQDDYGRIAAQTAKQVILQKIKEVERESILQEFESKIGEIISGLVQRIEQGAVFFDIGKTVGILPREEQILGEFYRLNQRFRLYVLSVEITSKGPQIILSRAYPKMVSKLFELEVPEISAGQVLIESIAREAGSRSKIAVSSDTEGMDPIGAMVGQRGTRVAAVINELGGEKVDIIEYSDEPEKYIANSLSPAKVLEVKIMPKNKAVALVPEDQLSLAIGKSGQNVRLAAKLTGWKIDVRSPEDKKAKTEDKETEKEPKQEAKSQKSKVDNKSKN